MKVNRTIHEATRHADGMKRYILVDIVKAGSFRVEVLKIVTLFAFVNCFMIKSVAVETSLHSKYFQINTLILSVSGTEEPIFT